MKLLKKSSDRKEKLNPLILLLSLKKKNVLQFYQS